MLPTPKTLSPLPSRANDMTESEEPRTPLLPMERSEATTTPPKTVRDDPRRAKDCNEIELPSVAKLRTDKDPSWTELRTEREDDRRTNARTERLLARVV